MYHILCVLICCKKSSDSSTFQTSDICRIVHSLWLFIVSLFHLMHAMMKGKKSILVEKFCLMPSTCHKRVFLSLNSTHPPTRLFWSWLLMDFNSHHRTSLYHANIGKFFFRKNTMRKIFSAMHEQIFPLNVSQALAVIVISFSTHSPRQ